MLEQQNMESQPSHSEEKKHKINWNDERVLRRENGTELRVIQQSTKTMNKGLLIYSKHMCTHFSVKSVMRNRVGVCLARCTMLIFLV